MDFYPEDVNQMQVSFLKIVQNFGMLSVFLIENIWHSLLFC